MKNRTQKFYDLEVDNITRDSIEVALKCVIFKTRIESSEEVHLRDNYNNLEFWIPVASNAIVNTLAKNS